MKYTDNVNLKEVLASFTDKIFAYALRHTYTRDEAEELTQEIFLQALRNIYTVKNSDKIEVWIWAVANNILKSFRRKKGRERLYLYSLDNLLDNNENTGAQVLGSSCDKYDFEKIEKDEIYTNLRRNIASLSSCYRDILIMYYYDNLTCKEIAQKLNIPEGTVTYRLSLGRNKLNLKLKKECRKMQNLKPVKLNLYVNGSIPSYNNYDNPSPVVYINDAVAHNILWNTYKDPKTVEQLSAITGVPAYYIEERIEVMLKTGAVIRPTQNTVQTNFIIWSEEITEYDNKSKKDFIKAMSNILFERTKKLTDEILSLDIHNGGRTYDELFCLFGIMATDYYAYKCSSSKPAEQSVKFDGIIWEYEGRTENYKDIRLYNNRDCTETLGHIEYNCPPFISRRAMRRKKELEICDKLLNNIKTDTPDEKETIAVMIEQGFITNNNGKFEIAMPVLKKDQCESLKKYIVEYFEDIIPAYRENLKKYTNGFKKFFPSTVKNIADNDQFMFCEMYRKTVEHWNDIKKVKIPDSAVCDVLLIHDNGMFL